MSSGAGSKAERVEPGQVLAGKFRVERVVGRGGMGVVIEATNLQLDQKVALKLLASGAEDPVAVERFSNEARAAARLRSEHVARVYDVGKDTLHGPFIVMELLEGKTLADTIQQGRVALHRAVEYVIDACEGLAEAHARGIVHRDVKPANLFLVTGADGRPSIKLLDFGIATMRSKDRERDAKSSHGSTGTPAYLAPEQLRAAQPVDHRADVWALGCVLYELLVGERPFRATRFTELVTKILEEPPHPLPPELELPEALTAVIERCLQKDREKRFTSTGELALALLPFARRRAHSAVTRAVAHVKAGGLDPHLEVPSSMPPPPGDSSADFPSSVTLRAAAVPTIEEARTGDTLPAPSQEPTRSTSTALAGPPAERAPKRGGVVIAAVLLLLLVGGGAAAWLRGTAQTARTTAGPTPTPPEPVVSATATASVAAPAVSASAAAAPSPTPSTAPSATPTPAARPQAPARPRPATPTASPTSESDIRLTR